MRFNSKIKIGNTLPDFTQEQVKNEVMFFSCDAEYVSKYGGPLSKSFIQSLPIDWILAPDLIIDSRVHMLMPGWFPCIPGYHHDDVPRERSDGQPEYFNPSYKAEHVMAIVNGQVAPTEFALGEADFPDVPLGDKYYKVWHPLVEEKLKSGELKKYTAESNKMIYFDWHTWHQGVPAVQNGWRWFMRATRNTGRKPKNEIRRQVQVYLERPMEGW